MTQQIPDERIEAMAEAVLRGIEIDGEDIVSSGLIYSVVATAGVVRVLIDDERVDLQQVMESNLPDLIQQQVSEAEGVVRVVVKPKPKSISVATPLKGVRHVIGVHSVKGGVGKSTMTAALALSLSRMGLTVGLLDADVYGPSVPLLFGVSGEPEVDAGSNKLMPVEVQGIRLMSVGFLLPDDEPLIWRGNLVDEGMPQLFADVNWGEMDVLLVDMPPGTGDVPIALARHVPLSGIVTVTAPSVLSVADVRRGLEFFADVQIPLLGLIENMSAYQCACGEVIPLFGAGAGRQLADELGLPLLAVVPFDEDVVAATEESRLPSLAADRGILEQVDAAASALISNLTGSVGREVVH